MQAENAKPRLAVLIDAENVPASIADSLFKEVGKIGEPSVRRIYGNFSTPQLKGWVEMLGRHSIVPQHQPPCSTGKNAADIALVIDAMDLLHGGRIDAFCLVSSDSDFTRLAMRIREHGTDVHGFGFEKTPESFRSACRNFVNMAAVLEKQKQPAKAVSPTLTPRQPPAAAVTAIRDIILAIQGADGWVALSEIGQQLARLKQDFPTREYGSGSLGKLVRRIDAFEVGNKSGPSSHVRIKSPDKILQTTKLAR